MAKRAQVTPTNGATHDELEDDGPFSLAAALPQPEESTRRERRYARRRQEILEATARVVSELGYHGTSLDAVAEYMDTAKATLYHYFKSRDEVVYECLATCRRYVIGRLNRIAESDAPPAERLLGLIREQLQITTRDYPMMSRLFLHPWDWSPELQDQVKAWQDEHNQVFRTVIREGIKDGSLTVGDETMAKLAMHGAMNQIPMWLEDRGKSPPNDKELQRITQSLMSTIFHVNRLAALSTSATIVDLTVEIRRDCLLIAAMLTSADTPTAAGDRRWLTWPARLR